MTNEEINSGISMLQREIEKIEKMTDSELLSSRREAIQTSVRQKIKDIFGENSLIYKNNSAFRIYSGAMFVNMSDNEHLENIKAGVPDAITTLKSLIENLHEMKEDKINTIFEGKNEQQIINTAQKQAVVEAEKIGKESFAQYLENYKKDPSPHNAIFLSMLASGEKLNEITEKFKNSQNTKPLELSKELGKKITNALNIRRVIPKKCFVVIASDRENKNKKHNNRYTNAIEPGIKSADYNPIRNTDDNGPNWFHDMIQNLRTCEMAVVDLTEMRFNCIWELGILNAWDVPIVIICPKEASFSKNISDIFTQRVPVFYNIKNKKTRYDKLKNDLKTKIEEVMSHDRKGQFLPKLDK
jgi:hypothetical protein